MSLYVSLSRKIIRDHEFRALSDPAKHIWFQIAFLVGQYGIDEVPAFDAVIRQQVKYHEPTLAAAFRELEDGNWLIREQDIIWLRNLLRYSPSISLDSENNRKGLERYLHELPRQPIVERFRAYYLTPPVQGGSTPLHKGDTNPLPKGVGDPLPKTAVAVAVAVSNSKSSSTSRAPDPDLQSRSPEGQLRVKPNGAIVPGVPPRKAHDPGVQAAANAERDRQRRALSRLAKEAG